MGVEVVPYENDFLGPGEMDIAKLFENLCVVDGRAALGNFDVAPTFERGKQHEQAGRAVALVFVVVTCRSPGLNGKRRSRFCDELFGCLVQAHERSGRVVRAGIHFQYILHRGHEPCVGLGRDDPVFLQVRFDVVFFSARATVLKWALSTILRSTTCSANRRIVQRAWPAGGCEQANAISWACRSPSKIGSIGGVSRLLRVSTASRPSVTSFSRTRATIVTLVSSAWQISSSDQPSPPSP